MALQLHVVSQAPLVDDLRGCHHRFLPLLPHRHCDPALLPRQDLEHPSVPADRPGRGAHQVFVRQLPPWKHRHGLHVLLLSVIHVKSATGKDVRNSHNKQIRLGNVWKEDHCGELYWAYSDLNLVQHSFCWHYFYNSPRDPKAFPRVRKNSFDNRRNCVCQLLGRVLDFVRCPHYEVWQEEERTTV